MRKIAKNILASITILLGVLYTIFAGMVCYYFLEEVVSNTSGFFNLPITWKVIMIAFLLIISLLPLALNILALVKGKYVLSIIAGIVYFFGLIFNTFIFIPIILSVLSFVTATLLYNLKSNNYTNIQ